MRLETFDLIDDIEEIDLENGSIRVGATLPTEAPVFDGHFPRFPILPGVMMLEFMNHGAGYLIYLMMKRERFVFLGGVKRAKFRRMVKPGAKLSAAARVTHQGSGFNIAETKLLVDGEVAADAEIIMIVTDFPNEEVREALAKRADVFALAQVAAP